MAEHLFDETLLPVASPALIARQGGVPTLDELQQWPLLGDPSQHWRDWFAQHGGAMPSRFVAHFDDSETMHRAAVEGMGVALARLARTRLLIESGQLVPLTERRLKTDYAHYLVYPQRSASHAGLLAFRDWVHAAGARLRGAGWLQHRESTATCAARNTWQRARHGIRMS